MSLRAARHLRFGRVPFNFWAAVAISLAIIVGGFIYSRNTSAEIATFFYNFNDEDELYEEFLPSFEDDIIDYYPDGGLTDSGSVGVAGLNAMATLNKALATPEPGETYTVSAYFSNYGNNGYGGLGFSSERYNQLGAEGLGPFPENGLGIAFHGGGGDFIDSESSVGDMSWSGGDILDQWYKMVFSITANNDHTYDLVFQIFPSDSDGVLGEIKTQHTLNDVASEAISESDKIYAYFAASGESRFDRVDNFEVEAELFTVPAPTAIRSYTDEETGDVFLGGDFIELGINKLGSFGTSYDRPLPNGFFGTDSRDNIGMSTNPAGFGISPDLRMDFFMPGTEEERWVVGYKQGDEEFTASNAGLNDAEDIDNNTVTDLSSGSTLKARSVGTFDDTLKTTQVVSFGRTDSFFKNEVTIQNVSDSSTSSVRYMRSFDPDNTVDQGGIYDTTNYIPYTHQSGDGKAVVIADTSNNDEDPVYLENGSRSPILFYSADPRARVSTFGFSNSDPYDPLAYSEALPKGTSEIGDQAITITFDLGTLSPGQSKTFVYYTSLDNRDFSEVLEDIEQANANNDYNGDNIIDDGQPYVHVMTSPITGKIVVLEVDSACEVNEALMQAESTASVEDPAYNYPEGLMNFTLECSELGYTTNVKQYYYNTEPSGLTARKYNPLNNAYFNIPSAVISQVSIYSQLVTLLSYSVTDGEDLDIDGEINGIIVDPAGLGLSAIGVPNTGISKFNLLYK